MIEVSLRRLISPAQLFLYGDLDRQLDPLIHLHEALFDAVEPSSDSIDRFRQPI